ncbi:unnamed protein product [Trichogramma brassicae]|uniref:C2H2-type domain-containing protein n=1 Tax=Trichogramma brassicae TaxID=86971 RepID=A0A6H5I3V3_9HYME|nr:unnamed protein product [Trichogramma brassicae]
MKFGKQSNLTRHQKRVHEGRKGYAYDKCEKKFTDQNDLTKHQNAVHDGHKEFTCDNCETKFTQKSSLLSHQKTVHDGRKDFTCDNCETKFTQKSSLLSHQKTVHEGRKDFACDKCETKYTRKLSLLTHQKTVHEGRNDYSCNQCEKKFEYKLDLLKHQKTVHEGRKDYACTKRQSMKVAKISHVKNARRNFGTNRICSSTRRQYTKVAKISHDESRTSVPARLCTRGEAEGASSQRRAFDFCPESRIRFFFIPARNAMDSDVQSTSTVAADSVIINIASSDPQDCSITVNASAAAFRRASAQSAISVPNDAEDATEDDACIITVSSNSTNRRRSSDPFEDRPPGLCSKLCRDCYRLSTMPVYLCFASLWLGRNLSDERRLGLGWRNRWNLDRLKGDRFLVQVPRKTPARLYHRFSVTRTADARGYTRRLIPTTFITI